MRVEADLFSGRPNPGWTLGPAEAEELADLVRELREAGRPLQMHQGLGDRGLVVTGVESRIEGCPEIRVQRDRVEARCNDGPRWYVDADRKLERWLLGSAQGRVEPAVLRLLREEVER